MRVWSPLLLTALAATVASCSGSQSSLNEDAGQDAAAVTTGDSAISSGSDAAPGSDSAISTGLDATPGTDAAGLDSATGTDAATAMEAGKEAGPEAGPPDSGTGVCTAGTPQTGGTTYTSGTGNVAGAGGYSYTLYESGSGGSMTVYGQAQFSAKWNNSGDFLARVGLGWNSTQTYSEIGTITATFAETKTGTAGGYSYIGIYGWSENPLHEYYIVDDWFGTGSPNPGGTKMGTITVDGGTYDVYMHTQTNQPSITGTATFVQFFSVRQTPRTCGTISISEHFAQWATMGMTLGNMEEARIVVEAGGGTGSIDFTTGTVTVN
jgi:endo-1,4-beta-xylanase